MTFAEFRQRGFLAEISRIFNQEARARQLLISFGYPGERFPDFDNAQNFWTTIAQDIAAGIMPQDDLGSLVVHAADQYPSNPLWGPYAVSQRSEMARTANPPFAPGATVAPAGSAMILGPPPAGEDLTGFRQRVAGVCTARGVAVEPEVVQVLENGQVELFFPGIEVGELLPVQDVLRSEGIRSRIIDDRHRERIYRRLILEGPDQARFEVSNVSASTPVGDLARAVINTQYDSNWPKDKYDKPRQATIDHIDQEGNERRLRPDDRLDDSNIEDGATLQVHPESTAGSLNPVYQQEALVRARNQVVRYARGHVGFQVQANSTQAPTEYILGFETPGIRPNEDNPGSVRHTVLLQLPEHFPSQAPAVWWQPPVMFHPNIDRGTGKVCLGVLDDRYRPGLDFGLLCQMLVDVASFRNYVVHEGYNMEACRWAASEAGQATIVAGGGRPEDPTKLAMLRGTQIDDDELPTREPGLSAMTRIERL